VGKDAVEITVDSDCNLVRKSIIVRFELARLLSIVPEKTKLDKQIGKKSA
jgi:hypothetical protein